MNFSFDSWPWKIALVVGLIAAREFVRLLSPKETAQVDGENGRWLIETIDSATIAIGLVLFVIQPFILQAFYIPSGSMENTLKIGDRLLVSKVVFRLRQPQRGDVIVFHAPPEAHPEAKDDDFIKRCIGIEGDVISAKDRTLTINGVPQTEPYTYWDSEVGHPVGYDMKIIGGLVYAREYIARNDPEPWTQNRQSVSEAMQLKLDTAPSEPIPTGKVLMMGDHRNNSSDGHVWGLLDKNRIVGKAVCVFWPGTRLGLVDRMSQPKISKDNSSGSDSVAFPTPLPNPAPNPVRVPAFRALHLPVTPPVRVPVRLMSQGARIAVQPTTASAF